MSFDVFISYARRDATPLARKLANDLRQANLKVFLDQDSIPAGANWEKSLDDALENATHILVILTPYSVSSEEVAAEWRPMLSKGKHVLPLMYVSCEVPRRLSMRQYVDFQVAERYPVAFAELIAAINTFSPNTASPQLSGQELLERGQAYFESGLHEESGRDYAAALGDADVMVRKRAAVLVGAAKIAGTLPVVLDTLDAERDTEVAAALLETIRRMVWVVDWRTEQPDLPERITAHLKSEEAEIRAKSIRALAYGKVYECVAEIVQHLLHDPAASVRLQAALSLGRLQTKEASEGLILALKDPHPKVRRSAVNALEVHADPAFVDVLRELTRHDPNAEVRAAARDAIQTILD